MFQYPDGVWNHGEGFVPGSGDLDNGGWHGLDDGTGVQSADVHTTLSWQAFNWTENLHPAGGSGGQTLRRFVGYLRPAGIPLQLHPVFNQGGNATTTWVDNAAFELFAPSVPWNGQDPIVLTVGHYPTLVFPPAGGTNFDNRTLYPGWYSPDGLIRGEPQDVHNGGFASNQDSVNAHRAISTIVCGAWQGSTASYPYYPICGYIVPPVIHRPATLTLQRSLQFVQAVKHLLQDPARTPLVPPLNAQQAAAITVVFLGGSDGTNVSALGTMLYPNIVHGGMGTVFNASLQRLYGEQEIGYALGHLSGFRAEGAVLAPIDHRNWGQLAWSRGLEVHDLSFLRRFLRNEVYRPFCLFLGDEDITGSGTDWIRILSGGATFQPSGQAFNSPPLPPPLPLTGFAWASVESGCHDHGPVLNPYTLSDTLWEDLDLRLIAEVVQAHAAHPQVPVPPITHLPRTAGEDVGLRGIDDPHEWALGRGPAGPPPTGPQLSYDPTFFNAAQPGAAGTWPGHKEAFLIHGQQVYVGSTDGVVSRLRVDWSHPLQLKPLVRDAQSPPLGHEAWGLLVVPGSGSSSELVVATRRHLHRLDPTSLTVTQTVQLAWEQAKPHRLQLVDAYQGWPGPEIVFVSTQGGLVIYKKDLSQWAELAEPGISDFVAPALTYNGNQVLTLMSERGVVANVAITQINGNVAEAVLTAASPPQQGNPLDLERADLLLGGAVFETLVGLYHPGGPDFELRAFHPVTLDQLAAPDYPGIALQLATVHDDNQANALGDHLLVLAHQELILFNEMGVEVGRKALTTVDNGPNPVTSYTPGVNAIAIAVGELGGSPPNPVSGYDEEVVVATTDGHLFWLHVDELVRVTNANALPVPEFTMVTGAGSAVQPRTNETLSCTWAMAEHPTDPGRLHLLDQSGNHWAVDWHGQKTLVTAEVAAAGSRGWGYVGVTGVGGSFPLLGEVEWRTLGAPSPGSGQLFTFPWCPISPGAVIFERAPNHPFLAGNWGRRDVLDRVLDGFAIWEHGGDLLRNGTTRHVFRWHALPATVPPAPPFGAWGDFLRGMRLNGTVVDGIWASTDNAEVSGKHAHHHVRNGWILFPSMDQQAMKVVELNGQLLVVLGCPGGRVRILQPGAYDVGTASDHQIGSVVASSADYGHGGSALAVWPSGNGLDIYFGVVCGHPPKLNYPWSALGDGEVLTGSIIKLHWDGTTLNEVWRRDLPPSSAPDRGGYGVVGLWAGDLIAEPSGSPLVPEIVATTLLGDVYVYRPDGTQQCRTWLPTGGAAGFYNSIIAADLNSDSHKELYLAGSMGLHRFTQPGEITQ